MPKMRRLLPYGFLICATCLYFVAGRCCFAADPTFVGVLNLASDDAVAAQLGLSDDVRSSLTTLIDKREAAALELAMQIKGASAEEQAAKLKTFREESERQGLQLLSAAQRKRLEQIRLDHTGIGAVSESGMAERLKLTPDQQSQIGTLVKDRDASLAKASGENSQRVRNEFERKLAGVLSGAQLSQWNQLTGASGADAMAAADQEASGNTPTADSKSDAAKADAAKAASSKTDGAQPDTAKSDSKGDTTKSEAKAADSKAEDRSNDRGYSRGDRGRGLTRSGRSMNAGAAGNETSSEGKGESKSDVKSDAAPLPKVEKSADGKVVFSFRHQPWKDVLEWFAQQADLSLVLVDDPPVGTFNYQDDKRYTPAEAIDIINSVLLTKNFTLVRHDRMLMLLNLRDGIPANLVPTIPLSELDERGKYELVCVVFSPNRLSPEETEKVIKPLLGPQGSIVMLPQARQLMVTETAGRLRLIKQVLERTDNPELSADDLRSFSLQYASPHDVLANIKQLYNIPTDKSATGDNSLKVMLESGGNRILVGGKPEIIQKVADVIKMLDVPGRDGAGLANEQPQLEVYAITTADPDSVLKVLQTLLAGQPDVRLDLDPKTGNLVALARPTQQATIRATLDQMQHEGRRIEVIPLRVVDPETAAKELNKLWEGEAASATSTPPKIEAEPALHQLIVRRSEAQIEQIRAMVDKLEGKDSALAAARSQGNVRVVPMSGRQARDILDQLQQIWAATAHRNLIRVVTPSADIPEIRPNGNEDAPSGGASDLRGTNPAAGLRSPAASGSGDAMGPAASRPSALRGESKPVQKFAPPATPDSAKNVPHSRGDAQWSPKMNGSAPTQSKPNGGGNSNEAIIPPPPRTASQSGFKVRFASQEAEIAQAADGSAKTSDGGAAGSANSGESAKQKPATAGDNSAGGTNSSGGTVDIPGAPIVVVPGASGLLIASDDKKALDDFEALLSTLASREFDGSHKYTVVYLKYARATEISALLGADSRRVFWRQR